MDKAESLRDDPSLTGEDPEAFRLVLKARDALKAVQANAFLELDDLEALFNAFEMAVLFKRLDPLLPSEVERLPVAMGRVIARTIERNLVFPVGEVKNQIGDRFPIVNPPAPYPEFANLLTLLDDNNAWSRVTVLTFNYDLALDVALLKAKIPFSYGLLEDSEGEKDARRALDFLKLHGSLNWQRCECGEVHSRDLAALFDNDYMYSLVAGKREYRLEASLHQAQQPPCGKRPNVEPFIVPPTWNKGQHHAQLASVWRRAAQHFSNAEYIFIMGYSYPQADEFFKYLYALGTVGKTWLKKVLVFNPDIEVGNRIKGLLGRSVQSKFDFQPKTFNYAIEHLRGLKL